MSHPWEKPERHPAHDEPPEEVFYLRHLASALEGLGNIVVEIQTQQESIMAVLDTLTAAVADLQTAATDAAARSDAAAAAAAQAASDAAAAAAAQQASIDGLTGQVTDLQAQVAALQADAVSQADLDALTASIAAIAATLAAIDAPAA